MGEALSKWQNDQPPPGNCQQAHTYYAQWSSTQHHEVPANSIHNLPATQGKLFRRPPPAHRNNNLLSYYRGELCDVQTQTNFSCPSTLLYRTSSSLSVSGNNNDAERSDKVIATRTEHHCLGQDEFESRWKPDSIVSENNLQTPTLPENLSNTTQNQCPQTSRHEPGTSSPNVYKYGQWPAYSPTVEQSRSENFSSSQYLSPLDLSLTSQLVEQQVVPHNEDDDSGDSHVDSADAGVFVNRASTWSSNRTIHELCHQDSPLVNFSVTQPPEWWAVRDARSHKVTHPIHRDGGPINYHHGDILLSRNHNLSSSSSQPVLPLTVVTASPLSLPPPLVVDDEEDDDDISAVYPIIHNGAIKKRRTNKRKKGKLWEFLLDLLLSKDMNPRIIRWEDERKMIFKIMEPKFVADLWGQRKSNPSMTFEKLSRAMRHYYKLNIMIKIDGGPHLYQFGDLNEG